MCLLVTCISYSVAYKANCSNRESWMICWGEVFEAVVWQKCSLIVLLTLCMVLYLCDCLMWVWQLLNIWYSINYFVTEFNGIVSHSTWCFSWAITNRRCSLNTSTTQVLPVIHYNLATLRSVAVTGASNDPNIYLIFHHICTGKQSHWARNFGETCLLVWGWWHHRDAAEIHNKAYTIVRNSLTFLLSSNS